MRGCSDTMRITLLRAQSSAGEGVCLSRGDMPNCVQHYCHCKNFKKRFFAIFAGLAICLATTAMPQLCAAPANFTNIEDIDSTIEVDMAYNTRANFTGKRVSGYNRNHCYLRDEAARALSAANQKLLRLETPMSIVVRDCWRPLSSHNSLIRWAQQGDDQNLKRSDLNSTQLALFQDSRLFSGEYLKPSQLFNFGYLSGGISRHSRGSTVDLEVLVNTSSGWTKADMGTAFDTFSRKSAAGADADVIGSAAKANRYTLGVIMRSEGFGVLATEWWHWTHWPSSGGAAVDGTVD